MHESESLHFNNHADLGAQDRTALPVSVYGESDEAQLMYLLSLLAKVNDDPIEGLAGYLVTEDPTYLPEDAEIKILTRLMGRDKLLRLILARILKDHSASEEV